MRFRYALCLIAFASPPAFAGNCNAVFGDYKLEQGDVESTSVVGGNNAQIVLSSEASKKLQELAEQNTQPVLIQIGTYQRQLVLKDLLGLDSSAPKLLENATLTIPGQSISDGLILQQQLRLCID